MTLRNAMIVIMFYLLGLSTRPCLGGDSVFSDNDVIGLSDEAVSLSGGKRVFWYEAGFEEQLPETIDNDLWNVGSKAPNLGAGPKTIWYRMQLRNDKSIPETYVFMSMDAVVSERVDLRLVRADGSVVEYKNGSSIAVKDRPIHSRLFALPVRLSPKEVATAYLGIRSEYNRNMIYMIRSKNSFERFEVHTTLFFGVYFAILILAMTVLFGLYVLKRDDDILAYFSVCFSTFLTSFVGMGFLNYLLPEDWVWESGRTQSIVAYFAFISILWFSKDYLRMKETSLLSWMVFVVSIAMTIILSIAILVRGQQPGFSEALNLMVNLCAPLALVVAARQTWATKSRRARVYLTGFGFYNIGGIIWTAQFVGNIPSTGWTVHAIFVGQLILNFVVLFDVLRDLHFNYVDVVSVHESQRYGERMAMMVRVLSHDLSNYLSIIDLTTNLVASDQISGDMRKTYCQKIKRALHNQKELIGSVRELVALEDGKTSLQLSAINVAEILGELYSTFEHRLTEKNVRLVIQNHDSQAALLADRKTLYHSVLCNIVSNAIKFSQKNSIIEISSAVKQSQVVISIRDHGVGMPRAILENVFNTSKATSRVGTGGEAGTGFGLPICKSYMKLYAGSIDIESKSKEEFGDDSGTTISLYFQYSGASLPATVKLAS